MNHPSRRPMTLTEKILLQHASGWRRPDVRAGDSLLVAVDWTLASEIAWQGMNQTYEALGRPPLHRSDRFYLALDHTVDPGTLANDVRTQKLVQLSRAFAKSADLRYFFDANTTIMHTEFYRQLVLPGEVVLGADSHTSSHGGLGAFAIGLGGADVVAAMVRGETWIQVPEAIRVHYSGRLDFGLTGKDVILRTLGQLGRNTAALERSVEYTADHPADLSSDFRFSIANMTAELGGLNGIFAPDAATEETLRARRDPAYRQGGWWFAPDPDAHYLETFEIALNGMGPQVARPFSPDNVCPVEEALDQALDGCFIGACTTSEEELVLAALVLEQAWERGERPVASTNRLVVPGSLEIVERLRERGLLAVFERAGYRIGEPGCSMCIGIASDRAQPGEVWLSSQNRNFPNRMGKGSIAWLASALTVAASSSAMRLADPRPLVAAIDRERASRFLAPRTARPSFARMEPALPLAAAPGEQRLETTTAQESVTRGRAQLFGDHVDTDAMIAAEFCHLTDLGELGARAFKHFRPEFVSRVTAGDDVIVAGEGWGTGSSREQAVWALRGAGVKAVVARSFAFIHKRNLVNEALPMIVLRDEAFYAAVRDGEPLEVDPVEGTVLLAGRRYQGLPLAGPMAEIFAAGGLIPYVAAALATPGAAQVASS